MPKSEDGQYELILENRQVLMIFFVAAALCGVFFGLGYMVGKNSGSGFVPPQQTATPPGSPEGKRSALAPVETPSQVATPTSAPTTTEPQPKTEPEKKKPEVAEKKPEVAEKREPAPPPPPAASDGVITLQVAALSKRDDADAMVALLKRKNFPVTLVTNAPDNLFRVQVGPYSSVKEAEAEKTRLEREGFKPIVKK